MKKHSPLIWVIGIVVIGMLGVMAYLDYFSNGKNVSFSRIDAGNYPKEITRTIVPQYREIERALATKSDDKIYVMVSRGEKPTSGYSVEIEKLSLERKDSETILVVYAKYIDPDSNRALAQMVTYPVDLAETNLDGLPDKVQLRTEYEQNSN